MQYKLSSICLIYFKIQELEKFPVFMNFQFINPQPIFAYIST